MLKHMLRRNVPVERTSVRNVKLLAKRARTEAYLAAGSDRYAWPALNDLDRQLVGYLPRSGVYLEVGANDGFTQSNTFYLDRVLGWTGILVEPIPRLLSTCQKIRRDAKCYGVALVRPEQSGEMVEIIDMDLKSVGRGLQSPAVEERRLHNRVVGSPVNVPGVPISDVIEHAGLGRPTLISLDVEGAELDVLLGLKASHLPDWLLVETKDPHAVASVLGPTMTAVANLSHHDFLYKRVSV